MLSTRTRHNRGAATLAIAAASIFGVGGLLTAAYLVVNHASSTPRYSRVDAPRDYLPSSLVRVGLGPEQLAAAGASEAQTTGVVQAAAGFLDEYGNDILAADEGFAAAAAEVNLLEGRITAGAGSGSDITALATARQTLGTATTARESVLDDLFAAATASLAESARTALSVSRANALLPVPVVYRFTAWTEPQWVALRDAIDHVRIAGETGREPLSEFSNRVADANGVAAVALAQTNLTTNGGLVQAAWTAAVETAIQGETPPP